MTKNDRPPMRRAAKSSGGDTDSVRRSGVYMPCRVCLSHSAPGAERICRRCAIRKAREEVVNAYAAWHGIATDDARSRLEHNRRAARWRKEMRRLDEIVRLKKRGDL